MHHVFQHSAHGSPTPSASFFNANWRLHLRLNAEKARKTTGNQWDIHGEKESWDVETVFCLGSWFTQPLQIFIPNETIMKTWWQLQVEVNYQELDFENGTTMGVKHILAFHTWSRSVGGKPAKQCRPWRLWVVQFLQFKHKFSTIFEEHPVWIPVLHRLVYTAGLHIGCPS